MNAKPADTIGPRLRALDANWTPPPPAVGVRVAMVCPHPDCNPRRREFDNPGWKCPTHGKAVRQPNARYFGQATE